MAQAIRYEKLDPEKSEHTTALVEVWNRACGEEFALSPPVVRHLLAPGMGIERTGRIAWYESEIVGFISASAFVSCEPASLANQGWIDAIAIRPDRQRQGIGATLLHWAETWLDEQGCSRIALCQSIPPFAPGLPTTFDSEPFFMRHGYTREGGNMWDVAANLSTYTPPPFVREIPGAVRPLQPGETAALEAFLLNEFPGRWHYEYQESLRQDGRLSDWMVLWTEQGIGGFCQLTFEDSKRPIERFYPYQLPRPWGQLGAIGIAETLRSQGMGSALLDAGLRRLYDNGVNGCVIDWTDLLDFYAKFGFTPYKEYVMLSKQR